MQLIDPATRERLLDRLAERAERRGSAASRGEVSMLAGLGILIWAFVTVTVLVSAPQALPLDPQRTSLSVGAGGGLRLPEADEFAVGARGVEVAAPSALVAAGPPATPAAPPNPTVTASPSPSPRAAAAATTGPATPTPTPAPSAVPTASATPALVAPPAVPPATPTPALTPAPSPAPSASPSSTPPAVQVVGANGAVLTGPRGGPLNTRGADLYNCGDFTSVEQLIAVFIASGPSDPNHLDPLRTGTPCPPEDEQTAE